MGASAVLAAVFVAVSAARGTRWSPDACCARLACCAAALAIFGTMLTWGGFLFAVALHLQGGLGDSPLRAGLTFIPGAAGFAFASLYWRRLPARFHRVLIVVGFALATAGYLGIVPAFSGGGRVEPLLEIVLALIGGGLGAAYSPLFTVALANVAPADAPDASGIMAMMLQLGQVVGVATFGTLYLSLAPSSHAITVTGVGLAAAAVAAGVCALPLLRR